MYGIAPQLPEIRSARCTVFTVARGEHTGEFTDWWSRVTGLRERERGRKLRRCGHAGSCYYVPETGSMPGPGNLGSGISSMIHSEYIRNAAQIIN